jgi:tyrosine-protein kinase Etk/Wzc
VKQLKPIEQETNIDFYKGLIKNLIKNWYLFVFSLIISMGLGHYIFKSSDQKYQNNMIMLIPDKSSQGYQAPSDLKQLQMFNLPSALDDELGILTSFPVIFEAVKHLNCNVSYYQARGLIKSEIYKNSPIEVFFDIDNSEPVNIMFEVNNITKDKFTLQASVKEPVYLYSFVTDSVTGAIENINISEEHNFGDEIKIGQSKFKVLLTKNFDHWNLKDKRLYFKFNNIMDLAYTFQSDLSVGRISDKGSLINITVTGSNSLLLTDFLNTLGDVYLNRNLRKKNKIADKTITFIDRQISGIADSLGLTADQLKDFRVRNNVMDINYLSQSVYEQMKMLENQKAELMVASKYYDYIKEYFENNKDLTDLNAPSAMGVNDPQLQSLITQLTEKNAQRSFQLDSKSDKNPRIPVLNAEINNLKKTILENIDYIVATSNITINDINNRIALLKGQVQNLPNIEKELKNIEREFHVNDAIYTFLLSTRAEAEIARASNSPDFEIIDPAKFTSGQLVAPKKAMIYFSAFFMGIMAPIALILLMSSFRNSVEDRREIEKLVHFPLIGTIARNDKSSLLPIYDFPKTLIAESFRSVKTSMQFFQKGSPKQKILVTSSMSGDGKTFIAMNLAAAYSYSGKRTLILEFDLRNPKLADYLELRKTKSLSSYLINDAKLEDIIQTTRIKNLDAICAGEVPPNPVELIASENAKNLIEIVQSIYDYIIIDTPPIGVVTDSYLLMEHSDVNLFVVRLNYTNKKFFSSLIKDIEIKEIPNIAILINNDEEKTRSVYYSDTELAGVSYFRRKFETFKALVRIKKQKS